ncbi:MAG: hypothetical protein FWB83_02835 [Treponema sp.]|nr:hypothetical protein [Treponema sp.]
MESNPGGRTSLTRKRLGGKAHRMCATAAGGGLEGGGKEAADWKLRFP